MKDKTIVREDEGAGRPDPNASTTREKVENGQQKKQVPRTNLTSHDVQIRIKNGLTAKTEGKRFEALTAKFLLDNGVQIENFGQDYGKYELDIELKNFIIECKINLNNSKSDKIVQQINLINIKTAGVKEIIIYSEKSIDINKTSYQEITQQLNAKGIKYDIIDDPNVLLKKIR